MRLALFGSPVQHSLSPRIHQAFAKQAGLSIDYDAIESGPHGFGRRLQTFIDSGGRGCNITVPLKAEAWELANRCSERAQRALTVNTLVFENTSDRYGDNTDGAGLVNDLVSNLRFELKGSRIGILGAGGAACGILGPLLEEQPADVHIFNRNPKRAISLAQRHKDLGQVAGHALDHLDQEGAFDLMINATALGHRGAAPGLSLRLFFDAGLCYDLNYGPAAQPLKKECQRIGVRYQHGLGMLVEQAALSFELWTGFKPDTGPVLTQLMAEA